jgi:hypothetical protein
MTPHPKSFIPLFFLAGLGVGLAVMVVRAKPLEFTELLRNLHLLPEPEKLTELYFENHLSLPNQVQINKQQSFSFTIHNLEYQPIVYQYVVTASDSAGLITSLASGSAFLNQDQYKTATESYSLATASGRVMIQVDLVGKNQPIHFWLENDHAQK